MKRITHDVVAELKLIFDYLITWSDVAIDSQPKCNYKWLDNENW